MAKTPTSKRTQATQERILQAALTLFEKHGVEGVRLEDIATVAGISRRAIYLHFASRSDLLVRLVAWSDDELGLAELVDWLRSSPTAEISLGRMAKFQVIHNPRIDQAAAALEAAAHTDEGAAAIMRDRFDDRLRNCRALVEWLHAEGRLADGLTVDDATDLVWTLISLANWRDLVHKRGWSPEQYVLHLTRLVRAAIVKDAAESISSVEAWLASDPVESPIKPLGS